tara:strand:+ start:447 stop:1235 length:789 start_codon:yes stop_codon:yes gene_type:complete
MNFTQPSIDPIIFSISFLEIRWYSLAYILGFVIGSLLIKKLNRSFGNLIEDKKLDSFFIWAVFGVILGGRIGYVFFYQINLFVNNPLYIFEIWNGGMSFHGGLVGLIISIYFFTKKINVSFFYLSDLVSIVAPIGIFFGRIANFINTELIGRPTDFFITIIYPSIDDIPRHPSQIYEALFEGIILFLILIIYFFRNNNPNKVGYLSGIFLIYYSIFRIFLEFLREPDTHIGLYFNLMSMGQILSLPVLLFGIFILRIYATKK